MLSFLPSFIPSWISNFLNLNNAKKAVQWNITPLVPCILFCSTLSPQHSMCHRYPYLLLSFDPSRVFCKLIQSHRKKYSYFFSSFSLSSFLPSFLSFFSQPSSPYSLSSSSSSFFFFLQKWYHINVYYSLFFSLSLSWTSLSRS